MLSGGRLDVAIGAGWNRPEYEAIGLPFDPVGVRVARLTEAITVLKGCFADGPFSFTGEYYTITDYDAARRASGRIRRSSSVAAAGARPDPGGARGRHRRLRSADLPLTPARPETITAAATDEKLGWVREAAGDRFASLEFNVYPSLWPVTLTEDPRAEAARVIDHMRGRTASS